MSKTGDHHNQTHDYSLKPLQRLMASGMGATVTALCTTPLDVVKTRLQAQQKDMLSSQTMAAKSLATKASAATRVVTTGPFGQTFGMFLKITRTEGPTSLWSGLPPTLSVHFIIYSLIFKKLKYISLSLFSIANTI